MPAEARNSQQRERVRFGNLMVRIHCIIVMVRWIGLAGVVACDPPRDLWNFLMVFGDAPKVHTLNPEP